MSRGSPTVAFALVSGIGFPANARAATPPTLVSVGNQQRHPTASWTLPPYVAADAIEIATKRDQASDGSFFTENVVTFDLLRPTDTTWLSADQLKPGTYYVHVKGWDNSCFHDNFATRCDFMWSNVMVLTITNVPPRLTGSIRFVGRQASFVQATFTVCDDVPEVLTLLVSERKWADSTTFAHSTWRRELNFNGDCQPFTVKWRFAGKFAGGGYYGVRLQVRDEDGALSNTLARKWLTGD